MRIGVIGGGQVGKAIARTYLEFVDEVRVWDILPERRTHAQLEVLACDIVFICLPTPSGKDGRLDLTALDDFFYRYRRTLDNEPINIVLKSTVPIGTTRKYQKECKCPNLVHSPEFLTARCADTDSMIPACNIIGTPGEKKIFRSTLSGEEKTFYPGNSCTEQLEQLYTRRFPGIPCKIATSDESEAIKLFTNGFYAVKVSYFNEIRCLADKLNLDWDTVVAGMLSQGRIAPYHYKVPGPDGKYGFGGDCLPKDLLELVCSLVDVTPTQIPLLSNAVNLRNKIYDRKR